MASEHAPSDNPTPTFFDTMRWPLIVIALLLGHTTLMLVCVTLATADPAARAEESSYSALSNDDQPNSPPPTPVKQ